MASQTTDGNVNKESKTNYEYHWPWQNIRSKESFTNRLACDIFTFVQVRKTGWKEPTKYLNEVLDIALSANHLSAACRYVRDKKAKIKNEIEKENFLCEPFYLINEPPAKKSKKSSKELVSVAETAEICNIEKDLMYDSLLKDYNNLMTKYSELMKQNVDRTSTSLIARQTQNDKRKKASIQLWKKKYFAAKKNNAVLMKNNRKYALKLREIKNLKSSITSIRHYYKKKLIEADEQLEIIKKNHNKNVKSLKETICQLEDQLSFEEKQENVIKTKINGMYTPAIRKAIYFAVSHQCPVDHAGEIIAYSIKELTGMKLDSTPHATTICRMTRELGILSDIQTGEALTSSARCTLGWDATQVNGEHINEIHVVTPGNKKYLTLSVRQLAGGKTMDYVDHIKDSLLDTSNIYTQYSNENLKENLEKVKENITCTISDRVAVNHCVSNKIKEDEIIHMSAVEVNCNVHPLDSFSSKSRAALKNTNVSSNTWGKDCAAVNVIHAISKLRYKQGKGDPITFKSFMKSEHIPLKDFPRYVGNRMHVVFHLAGSIMQHKEQLYIFLTRYCASIGGLTSAVAKDLQDPDILCHLAVLGLFGKIVTGPWMRHLYQESTSNLDRSILHKIGVCVENLRAVSSNPSIILHNSSTDIFDTSLNLNDPVLISCKSILNDLSMSEEVIKLIADAMISVCDRQLTNYTSNSFTEEDQQFAVAAPTHNMQAERILGMADAQCRRAPNAQDDFLEAKVKSKTNQTLTWLQNMSEDQQKAAIVFATKKSKVIKINKQEKNKAVQTEIIKRLKERARKYDESERRKLEKKISDLEDKSELDERVSLLQELAPTLSDDEQNFILDILTYPSNCINKTFFHTWYDTAELLDVTYKGRIIKLKKRKRITFVVAYHDVSEQEDEAVDYDITRNQLLTDLLLGDLVLA